MKSTRISIALLILLMAWNPIGLPAQESGVELTPRSIRARKLAQNWQGKIIQITLTDGRLVIGRFIEADFYSFTLETGSEQVTFPIDEVKAVTLKPGIVEIGLALVSGIMGGGFGAGIIVLTVPDYTTSMMTSAAVLGGGVGLWWGYKAFYQEEVIDLEE